MIRLIPMISVLAAAAMAGVAAWTSLGDEGGPKPVAPARPAQTKRVEGPRTSDSGRSRRILARPWLRAWAKVSVSGEDGVGFQGRLVFDTAKPDGTPRKLLDINRLKELGWAPRVSLAEGLKLAYRDFLQKTAESNKSNRVSSAL